MVLGDRVNGLMMDKGWRFVTGDSHDICRRVTELDSDARLVGHETTGEIGVAAWVARAKMGAGEFEDSAGIPIQDPGGAWLLAFRLYDEDGRTYKGEPTEEVIRLMNRSATTRRRREDLERFAENAEAHHTAQMLAWERETEGVMGEIAEEAVYGHYRDEGRRLQHIYVPKGAALDG